MSDYKIIETLLSQYYVTKVISAGKPDDVVQTMRVIFNEDAGLREQGLAQLAKLDEMAGMCGGDLSERDYSGSVSRVALRAALQPEI